MGLNVDDAVSYAKENAEDEPQSRCARYVREALEAGGLDLSHHPISAKDYGPTLLENGFEKVHEFKQISDKKGSDYKGPLAAVDGESDKVDIIGSLLNGGAIFQSIKMTEFKNVVQVPLKPSSNEKKKAEDYNPSKGDVVVIQPYTGGSQHGHIAIYTGTEWISDFKQHDMWGGGGYRKHKPPSAIYRPK